MAYIKPNKIITGTASLVEVDRRWTYDDGTGDLWLSSPYHITYDVSILPRSHSSHLVKDLGGLTAYTGLDIRVGDWVTNENASRAWEVVDLDFLNESSVRVVLQDTYRQNQFQRDDSTGNGDLTPGDLVFFEVKDGVPQVFNLPATVAGTLSLDWASQISARFDYLRGLGISRTKRAHGLIKGQLLRLAVLADVVTPSILGSNLSPTTTAGDRTRINGRTIVWPALVGTTDIVTFLNAQNLPDGIVASDLGGLVSITSTSSKPISVYDRGLSTSASVGIGWSNLSTGVGYGEFIPATSTTDKAIAVVSELGSTPDDYFFKWLGTSVEVNDASFSSGLQGDVVYLTGGNFTTVAPVGAVSQSFIVASRESNVAISSKTSPTSTATVFLLNKQVVTPATMSIADVITAVNAGTALHGVTASSINAGTAVLLTGGSTPGVTRDVIIGDNFGPGETFASDFGFPACNPAVSKNVLISLSRGAPVASAASGATILTDPVVKTATFTCVAGNHYLVDTTLGGFSVTMPAAPVADNIVMFTDVGGSAAAFNLVLSTTAQKFHGKSDDFALSQNNGAIAVKYVDATTGWVRISDM